MQLPRTLVIAAAVAFIASLALSFHWQFRPRVDAGAYDAIGWNLARGYGYVENEVNRSTPELDDAIVRVGPGYEFFLAGIYKLVGHRVPVVWILQAALHASAMLLVYKLTLLLFPILDKRIGVLASLLFGFSPDLIFINSMLLTEGLFLFLMLAALYAIFLVLGNTLPKLEGQVLGWLLAAGILWALAVLTRPIALIPLLVLAGVLLWQQKWRQALVFFLPTLILVGAWSGTMTARYNHFILTTTAGGLDLWVGNNLGATGGFVKTPEIQQFRDANHSVVVDEVGKQKYVEFIKNYPAAFLELQVRKAALYVSVIRPTGLWLDLQFFPVDRLLLLGVSAIWTLGLFLVGCAGLVLMMIEHFEDIRARLFVAIALLQPLMVIPIIVETRYRYALFPFLAIGVAYLIAERLRGISARVFWNTLLWPAVVITVLTFYDLSRNIAEIISKVHNVLL